MTAMSREVLERMLTGLKNGNFAFVKACERYSEIDADIIIDGIDIPVYAAWAAPVPEDGATLAQYLIQTQRAITEEAIASLVYVYLFDLENDALTPLGVECFPELKENILAGVFTHLYKQAGVNE